jgi:hypothetical protein
MQTLVLPERLPITIHLGFVGFGNYHDLIN